jgi:hypothetical protein
MTFLTHRGRGTDIFVTSADGATKLNHELESYNPATGQIVAWVQLPSLSPIADTTIYIYYGNSLATDQQNKVGVWDGNYTVAGLRDHLKLL